MAETDFADIRSGSRYRGTRFPGFSTGGVDVTTGNQSQFAPAYGEAKPTQPEAAPVSQEQAGGGLAAIKPSGGLGGQLVAAGLPYAATKLGQAAGGAIGTNLAAGASFGEATKAGLGAAVNKGLGGITASGSGFVGPPTAAQSAAGSRASGIGGSVGAGIGTFAAGLLTGQSFKQAAAGGIGSAAGTAIGTAIGGPVGGFIGGTIGSFASKLFGGKKPTNAGVGGAFHFDTDQKDFWWDSKKGNSAQNLGTLKQVAGNVRNFVAEYNRTNPGTPITGFVNNINAGVRDRINATLSNGEKVTAKPGDFQGFQDAIISSLQKSAKTNYQTQQANRFAT